MQGTSEHSLTNTMQAPSLRPGDARSGRDAVARAGGELVPAFRERSECFRRPPASGQHPVRPAAGGRDPRALSPPRLGKATDEPAVPATRSWCQKSKPSIRTRIRTRGRRNGLASTSRTASAPFANTPICADFVGSRLGRTAPRLPGVVSEPSNACHRQLENPATKRDFGPNDGETRTRTGDTTIFRQAYGTLEHSRNRLQTSEFWTAGLRCDVSRK
jgi:hypothetical protein